MRMPVTFLQLLEKSCNKYLHLDSHIQQRLSPLKGKVIAVHLRGINAQFYLLFSAKRVRIQNDFSDHVDTTLIGTPFTFLRAVITPTEKQSHLFGGDLEIIGDATVGHDVKNLLNEIDIDWEEQLSIIIGDVAAHSMMRITNNTWEWIKQGADKFQQNVTEYLQEEAHLLPPVEAVEDFYQDIVQLRTSVDRLAAKIERLSKQDAEQHD